MKKSILVFLAEGFEEMEAISVIDILRRAGVTCDTCSLNYDKLVTGSHKVALKADITLNELNLNNYDGIVLPGGMPGSTNLKNNTTAISHIKEFYNSQKLVAAICAAPIVLEEAGILKNKNVTSYPNCLDNKGNYNYKEDIVVKDGNIITSRGPATAPFFAFEILKYLGYEKEANELSLSMLY